MNKINDRNKINNINKMSERNEKDYLLLFFFIRRIRGIICC